MVLDAFVKRSEISSSREYRAHLTSSEETRPLEDYIYQNMDVFKGVVGKVAPSVELSDEFMSYIIKGRIYHFYGFAYYAIPSEENREFIKTINQIHAEPSVVRLLRSVVGE